MIEGSFSFVSSERREANGFEVLHMIAMQVNELRDSLIEASLQGPVEYTYMPED